MKNWTNKLSRITLAASLLFALVATILPASEVKAVTRELEWVGGNDTWNATAGNKWAIEGTGVPGEAVPDADDNVHFNAGSGAVIVATSGDRSCLDLDFTGFTGTFGTYAGGGTTIIYGSLILVPGMVYTDYHALRFAATSGSHTVTTASKIIQVTFAGIGGEWTLQDNVNAGTASVVVTGGTLNTNDKTIATGNFNCTGASVSEVNLGASVINTGSVQTTNTNCTINAGTSVINCTGAWFYGGGHTFNEVNIDAGPEATGFQMSGENTFADLTIEGTNITTAQYTFQDDQVITGTLTMTGLTSTYKRLRIRSDVIGTSRQLTAAAVNITNCSISDIAGVGAASWDISAGKNADLGGNFGIIFTVPQSNYWVGNSGDWSDEYHWALTTGGTGGTGRVPLESDTAIFDSLSFTIPARTVTMDVIRVCEIAAAGVTNAPTFTSSVGTLESFGSLWLGTVTWNPDISFKNRLSTNEIDSLVTLNGLVDVDCYDQTTSFTEDVTIDDALTLTSGVLDLNDYNITALTFASATTTYGRYLYMGSGVFTLNSAAATTKWNVAAANLGIAGEESTILFTNSGANAQTFAGGSIATYNNLTIAGAGAYTTTVTGTNSFGTLTIDRNVANKTISGAVTITLTDAGGLVMPVSAARTITITNTDFTMASGIVLGDYLIISGSSAGGGATFFASVGGHSTDNGGNTGWLWTPPTAPTIATLDASDVTYLGERLNGELLTAGSYATFYVYFQYGPTAAYGFTTPEDTIYAPAAFDEYLSPYKTYHFRAVVRFGLNDHAYGNDKQVSLGGAVGQAKAAISDPGESAGTALVSAAPVAPDHMYTEGDTDGLFGLGPVINPALAENDIPVEVFWYPIAFLVAIVLGFAAYAKTRSLPVQAVVSAVVMAAFCGGGALGDGLLPYWTVLVFIVEAVMLVVIQEKQNA